MFRCASLLCYNVINPEVQRFNTSRIKIFIMEIDQSIFKAYDIRGVYPDEIDEKLVYKIAQAYVRLVHPKTVVVGHDMRLSGEVFKKALVDGLTNAGVNVIDLGLVSTDTMYFAVPFLGADGGIQATASHNPKEFGGLKMVREKGRPISGDSGIYEIRDMVAGGQEEVKSEQKGSVIVKDLSEEYIAHVLKMIDVSTLKPLKVVANTNFGMASVALERLKKILPIEFVEILNGELNGNFPKGRPDPLVPENRLETQEAIKNLKADLGVAWDADADRCFFFDETGRFLSGYFTTAILSELMLKRYPKSKVIVDMKLNWAIIDTVSALGGHALPNKTGHSFFKERMIAEDAVFGGEVSAHYYFKDNFYLDNGIIPFLLMLSLVSTSGKKMSELYEPLFKKYFAIEETNVKVENVEEVIRTIKEKYSDGHISELDGVSIDFPEWRLSLRSSNTEPLVRLNLEAKNEALMQEKAAEVLAAIKK
jgi:phosphomannomutase